MQFAFCMGKWRFIETQPYFSSYSDWVELLKERLCDQKN
jgi:hypothetical protein